MDHTETGVALKSKHTTPSNQGKCKTSCIYTKGNNKRLRDLGPYIQYRSEILILSEDLNLNGVGYNYLYSILPDSATSKVYISKDI